MTVGIVKFFNDERGYGFISPDDGSAGIFVHVSALRDANIGTLVGGQRVSFDIVDGRNGRTQAANLRLV